jgi:hypothetical protein
MSGARGCREQKIPFPVSVIELQSLQLSRLSMKYIAPIFRVETRNDARGSTVPKRSAVKNYETVGAKL